MTTLILTSLIMSAAGCNSTPADSITSVFGKKRPAYEAILGSSKGSEKDEFRPDITAFKYEWNGRKVTLKVEDKTDYVEEFLLFTKEKNWPLVKNEIAEALAIEGDKLSGTPFDGGVKIAGVPGVEPIFHDFPGLLSIWMPEEVVPPAPIGALDPALTKGLRSIIGSKSDTDILETLKSLSGGEFHEKTKWWSFDSKEGKELASYRLVDASIGNNGTERMLASPLGKLPIGIFYVGRGSSGKGPALVKLTYLQNATPEGALDLVAAITDTPKSKLTYGKFHAKSNDAVRVRYIDGSKYKIYAVGWRGKDPKDETNQIVISSTLEMFEFVTMS